VTVKILVFAGQTPLFVVGESHQTPQVPPCLTKDISSPAMGLSQNKVPFYKNVLGNSVLSPPSNY
jgi:hypothetical protein